MATIAQCLELRYPGEGRPAVVRDFLNRICEEFLASGLADPKFEAELTSGSDAKFWSSLSEALIFQRLRGKSFAPRSGLGTGPDFLLELGTKRLWIEVTCPEPTGVPADWLRIQANSVTSLPHEAILLRWTSAIRAKIDGLLGSTDGRKLGYLQTGLVSPNDVYVIAVNGCQMRHGPFPCLHGISQFPYAAEAVFPIGPYQLHIDTGTLKTVGRGHQHRLTINKPSGSPVPTHVFLDSRNRMVSAIWAVDFTGYGAIGNPEPSALIHNPGALNPLPRGFLAVDEEYEATQVGDDELLFQRVGVYE
jgi:type I restriction enzyme S subunit